MAMYTVYRSSGGRDRTCATHRDHIRSLTHCASRELHESSLLFFFFFLQPHLQHMDIPRPGFKLELQLPAIDIVIQDPSCTCKLHHSLRQCQKLNPLIKAKDQTFILTDTMLSLNMLSQNGNSSYFFNLLFSNLNEVSSFQASTREHELNRSNYSKNRTSASHIILSSQIFSYSCVYFQIFLFFLFFCLLKAAPTA